MRTFRTRVATAIAVAAFGASVVPVFAACPHAHEPLTPTMTTLAGRGSPGIAGGAALTEAQFIEPSAVAVDRDGSILVADAGAHLIRRVAHGIVTTVAGTSKAGPSPEQRLGGYLDGPAQQAQFDRPVGLAVGSDGAIYVADSINGAIRRIKGGQVTTLVKGLDDPRALAFDDDGILYVGDHGSGVRTVSLTDGSLSPLDSISDKSDRAICGLSVRGKGKNLILAYTDTTSIRVVEGTAKRDLAFDEVIDPTFDKEQVGPACGVQVINRDSLIASDLHDNDVKFIRLQLKYGSAEPPMVRLLSSGRRPAATSLGGFADGPPAVAQSDLPGSYAAFPNGKIVFADTGNRRVREISDIDARGPVSGGADGTLDITPASQSDYRIAFVGNSFAFTNSMWPDSIPGQIERALSDTPSSGLTKCPNVTAYRLSGASIGDAADFVTNEYGDGEADLVIFLVDAYNLQKDIQALQKDDKGQTSTDLFSPVNDSTGWRQAVPKRLRDLRDLLAKSHTSFAVVTIPDGRGLSTLENIQGDELRGTMHDLYTDYLPGFWTYKMSADFDKVFAQSGAHTILTKGPLTAAEDGDIRTPLFSTVDEHPSVAGNIEIGRIIARDLLSWKPWLGQK